jgi:site-specific DNA-methyltransferase (adenine-specific)
LGKAWDANTGALETYQECLRVLKPGGHILAFSAARTYHHLAVTLEQAGFEIRDQIMWIYSSGFPKSQDIGKSIDRAAGKKDPNYKANNFNATSTEGKGAQGQTCVKCNITLVKDVDSTKSTVGKCKEEDCAQKYTYQTEEAQQWAGWGTALKPAHEPIVLARKPIKLSIAKNAQQWGTGALNIDATRIPTEDVMISSQKSDFVYENFSPENRINKDGTRDGSNNEPWQQHNQGRFPSNVLGDIPDYQKYFYCPKVSRRERHIGFDEIPYNGNSEVGGMYGANQAITRNNVEDKGNNHPTVKPIELMKYLIKLITPPGGVVLDPFNGSGSTGCAAVELGHDYIGCELDPAYVEITNKRILAWTKEENIFSDLFKE